VPQIELVAVVEQTFLAEIKYGKKRKTKWDRSFQLEMGEVVMLVAKEEGQPEVFRVAKSLQDIQYDPGNRIGPGKWTTVQRHQGWGVNYQQKDAVPIFDEQKVVLYHDARFCVYTTQSLMKGAMLSMVRANVPMVDHLESMERYIIQVAQKMDDVPQVLEKGWEMYFKLRARFSHPTTPKPEADTCRRFAAGKLKQLVMLTLNENGG